MKREWNALANGGSLRASPGKAVSTFFRPPTGPVTLNLPPEKEAVYKARAQARGLSVEQWMLEVADQHVQPVSVAHLQKTDPQEWAKYFDAWVDRHNPKTPVLSEEAMSRESIYPDPV